MPQNLSSVRVIDSHTGGEPTRVVVERAPDLGRGSMHSRRELMRQQYDWFRSAIVNEPRGSDVLVGALLCEPESPDSAAGTIFFNNVGYLGMCGHGSIGLAVTLAHLGSIEPGAHRLETPAGNVMLTLHDANRVTVDNVASYRFTKDLQIDVPGIGTVSGDIAWGGNWFFLIADHGQTLELGNSDTLTSYTWAVRQALDSQDIRGADGELIDHVELFTAASDPQLADSRNFVLCPGKAYDRSPCGTGTSAKVACLVADGKLAQGDIWRQESITGSVFEADFQLRNDSIIPSITGTAYITGDCVLNFDPADPFVYGLTD